jgi:thiol-disulfide isomerase/thioredoxin
MNSIDSTKGFYEEVEKDQVSFIYFYTKWCPDCFAIKPHLPRLEQEYPNVVFYSFDRDVDIELAKHLEIYGIPSFLMFKNGEEIGRFVDKTRKTYDQVKAFIDQAL